MAKTRKVPNEKAGERLKELIKRKKISQVKLAEIMDISKDSISLYVRGRQAIPDSIAEKLYEYDGKIPPYWRGETDCDNWEDYMAALDHSEYEALVEYEREQQKEIAKRKILFELCGYEYELVNDAASEFAEVLGMPAKGPHRITDIRYPQIHYALDYVQMQSLMEKLKNTIGFVCYESMLEREG